ncbi:hypothetical protein B0H15DRAFT_956509 [Mycena belliarum]|uniref:Uncharacterized protein n=1 Tax=Mycena belliarum TaxID=1033014 RepID=A0AAD6TP75_9AGAR|nr:hypothetical protein B0H15DRAFT_956509 [Mycena belliae]
MRPHLPPSELPDRDARWKWTINKWATPRRPRRCAARLTHASQREIPYLLASALGECPAAVAETWCACPPCDSRKADLPVHGPAWNVPRVRGATMRITSLVEAAYTQYALQRAVGIHNLLTPPGNTSPAMGNLAPTHWVTGSSSILGCELATTITTPASATLTSELVSSRTE